jgi:N-sulfoglucosamine sulfohydrolase
MLPISGKSVLHILKSKNEGVVDESKEYVFAGRERHSSSRYLNWGYPQRAIRSHDYLLVWNMKPERWPAGAPQRIKPGTETNFGLCTELMKTVCTIPNGLLPILMQLQPNRYY